MEFKHFSHPHNLSIHQVRQGENLRCACCESPCPSAGSIYACWNCSFFLDEQCGNAKRAIEKHPSHTPHPLTLVPFPTHNAGTFTCNACQATGTSFSYCCALCDFDLHVQCALLPKTIEKNETHPHKLSIHYSLPKDKAPSWLFSLGSLSMFIFVVSLYVSSLLWQHLILFVGVSFWFWGNDRRRISKLRRLCNICNQVLDQNKNWVYNCSDCDYRVHVCCATMATRLESDQAAGDVSCGAATTNPQPEFYEEGNASQTTQDQQVVKAQSVLLYFIINQFAPFVLVLALGRGIISFWERNK